MKIIDIADVIYKLTLDAWNHLGSLSMLFTYIEFDSLNEFDPFPKFDPFPEMGSSFKNLTPFRNLFPSEI